MTSQIFVAYFMTSQAALGLLVGALLWSAAPGDQPRYARQWALAWGGSGIAALLGLCSFFLVYHESAVGRLVLGSLASGTALCSAALLILGALTLKGRSPSRRSITVLLMAAALVGVASILVTLLPGLDARHRYWLRVSFREFVLGVGFLSVALTLLRSAPAGSAAARRIFVTATALLGLVKMVGSTWGGVASDLGGSPYPFISSGVELVATVLAAVAVLGWHLAKSRDAVVAAEASARDRVRESEGHFLQLLQGGSDIIAVLGSEGTFSFVSPAAQAQLGWAPHQLVGRVPGEWVHPDDFADIDRKVRTLYLTEGEFSSTFRFRHAEGSWRTIEGLGRFARDPLGRPLVVVNARDVTEREAMRAQLMQANKMESIGRLAGGVAHDFNNILTGILASAEMARESTPRGSPAMADLDEIRLGAVRAAALTRQLLTFARQDESRPSPIEVNGLVQELSTMLRRLVDEEVSLTIEPAEGALWANVDRTQLEQVLVNLVVNARDATSTGGNITIRTRRAAPLDDSTPEAVELEVLDDGRGMTPEVRRRIFEPFFTTKTRGKGTGLGLAVCYGIVTRHGGTIDVHSHEGIGTVFRVRFPALPEPPVATRDVASTSDGGVPGGRETVLLVEDDTAVREVTARALRRAGYAVHAASNGAEALARLDDLAPVLALVVSDVVMPAMDGAELGARVRQRLPHLPIVLTTGYPGTPERRQGIARLGATLLQKPYSIADLLGEVRRQLDATRRSTAITPDARSGRG